MKKRPMKDLFVLLEQTGAEITYLEQEGFLPVKINGQRKDQKLTVRLDISRSTQFLSHAFDFADASAGTAYSDHK